MEGLKWLVMEINYQWTPGASRRRLRRLERLREATTRAIQEELERRASSTAARTFPSEVEEQGQSEDRNYWDVIFVYYPIFHNAEGN